MVYPAIWWGWSPPLRLVRFIDNPPGNLAMFLIPSLILGTGTARLHFGLPATAPGPLTLTVTWPDGALTRTPAIRPQTVVTLQR